MQTTPSPAHPLGKLIFLSRWLQAPLYFGLIVAQSVYVYRFFMKLGTALIGISSIHLLKTLIDVSSNPTLTDRVVLWQVTIHVVFVASAFMLAWTDRVSTQAQASVHHK
jgi:uncharacterized membrane protein YqhA